MVDGFNTISKHCTHQLMPNVQLPVSKTFYSHILMCSSTQNNYVSMTKELQNHMYKEHQQHGVIYHGKYRKRPIKIKWTDTEYHVQDNSDVAHK